MKKKLFVVALSLSMVSTLMFGVALAGTTYISGTTGASSLVEGNVAVGCANFNTSYQFGYELHTFTVSVTGVYSFGPAAGLPQPPYVPFQYMVLYGSPFVPGNPSAGCMASGYGFSATLVAGHSYQLQDLSGNYLCPYFDYPCFGSYKVAISGPGDVILLPNPDDRINWDSSLGGPVALYCHGDNKDTLQAWIIDQGSGKGAFLFEWDNFSDPAPATNTLLFDAGTVQLWHLTSGEYEVHAVYSPQYGVWKGYAFIFNGCPYDGGGYTNNFDPGEGQ